ncbi:hypothetical protein [Haloterrigena alkaliphila]|uniref:Uncharacterized protein n=1 Tax=Haloterrigena alkaliphila TaxID=2816475 RepID=A0A8A2V8I5_9EURY|nr:hypothetical protein [Haloterrigena alkaliphila]QSW98213.1 hypothetical protein J0X25_12450 [Haloterrigena alkaliphila]
MSGQPVERRFREWGTEDVLAITTAGLVGGIGFAIVLAALGLLDSVGVLVDAPGLVVGLPLALIAGVVGAFVYRALGTLYPFEEDVTDPITGVTLGTCFGVAVWVIGVAVLVPLWLRLLGRTPPFPFLHWQSLVALLVYGAIVGPASPLVERYVRL